MVMRDLRTSSGADALTGTIATTKLLGLHTARFLLCHTVGESLGRGQHGDEGRSFPFGEK